MLFMLPIVSIKLCASSTMTIFPSNLMPQASRVDLLSNMLYGVTTMSACDTAALAP